MNMDKAQYKDYHEKFMQNHSGTSALDVFMTITPNIFTPSLVNYLISFLNVKSNIYQTCLELIGILIPMILTTTVLSEFRYIWLGITFALFLYTKVDRNSIGNICKMNVDRRRRWDCISSCRGLTGLLTAHCILAVDFNIFPRYFAKTEQFGFSLMDTGVGLYVFCNAIVPTKVSRHSVIKSIEMNMRPCFILMTLGILRTVIIRGIDYQQHITEYGVHWNFFITLSVTKFVCTIILATFKENNSLFCGVSLLVIHEILLQKYFAKWVMGNIGRYNFITANREGVVSCTGYIALYLISVHIGQVIREKYKEKTEKHVTISLFIMGSIFWISIYVTNSLFSTSRNLANMGYCFFILAIGTSVLTIHYLMELIDLSLENKKKVNIHHNYKKKTNWCNTSKIYSAINKNGLLFFLLANIFTGIINMCVRTLFVGQLFAIFVLFMYLVIVCGLVIFMEETL